MVVKLLECNADPNIGKIYAVQRCVESSRLDIMTALLEFGADIHTCNDAYFGSPLEIAARDGNLDAVIKLLEYDDNTHHCDYALVTSIGRHHFKVAAVLLEIGATIRCSGTHLLKDLQDNFDEEIADFVVRNVPFLPPSLIHETKVSLLRLVLPRCSIDDYKYFPPDYIRTRLPTASTKKVD